MDEVEREVNRIWFESPGTGVKELMRKLEALQITSEITQKRVKAAKQAIPYTYVQPDQNSNDSNAQVPALTEEQISFVKQKIQERTSVRSLRRYGDADEITRGLTAFGIVLDDGMKTWTIGKKNTSDIRSHREILKNNEEIMAQQKNGVACQFCNRYFASKNLVFRHLRDVSTSCGNAIFVANEKLPDAPSTILKRHEREAAKALRRKTGKAKQFADTVATLWFGDLPIPYTRLGGQYRRLKAVLREYLPRDVPQPWIKRVVRKGYRRQGKMNRDGEISIGAGKNEGKGDGDGGGERDEYLGYAIIVFRDEEEANNVKAAMDGIHIKSEKVFPSDSLNTTDISSFIIKVKNVLHNQSSSSNGGHNIHTDQNMSTSIPDTYGGQDPPLMDQLLPLSIPELQKRCEYLRSRLEVDGQKVFEPEAELNGDNGIDCSDEDTPPNRPGQEHNKMLQKTVSLYNAVGARDEVFHQGRMIPESIRNKLLCLLQNVRWQAASHRKGLTSDHYLILQTNVANDRFYNDLRIGCRELMNWADPDYYYSGIAVTKNFVGSPHIDDRDQSFQYAVSLGDFSDGGELCVEGKHNTFTHKSRKFDYVNVVETRNRIAKVDGRNIHWVRSWMRGKDRYSLIFYDTTDRHQTDVNESGVDLNFVGS